MLYILLAVGAFLFFKSRAVVPTSPPNGDLPDNPAPDADVMITGGPREPSATSAGSAPWASGPGGLV